MNFKNLKVGTKITVLTIILLLFMAFTAVVGLNSISKLNDSNDVMYNYEFMGLSYIKEANIDLLFAARALRNAAYYAEFQPIDNYVRNQRLGLERMSKNLDAAMPLFRRQQNKDMIIAIQRTLQEYKTGVEAIIRDLTDDDNSESARKRVSQMMTALRPTENKLDDGLTEITKIKIANGERALNQATELFSSSRLIAVSILAVSAILGMGIGIFIMKSITGPLGEIGRKSDLVVGGDLNQEFKIVQRDELGFLGDTLDKMVGNLRARIAEANQKSKEAQAQSERAQEAMREAEAAKGIAEEGQRAILRAAEQIEGVVSRLGTATEELSAQVEEASRGADVQRDRVTTAATAMEEMNVTAGEVAGNAGHMARSTDQAREKAEGGMKVMRQTVATIDDLHKKTAELKNMMLDLGKQTEAIGSIMVTISDIADQTNLLALNAAIEAARAGDAGRGFAVVADEVRKLAEKTMQATKEVGDSINGIQQGTRNSITSTEQTSEALDHATTLASQSGTALGEIVADMVTTADQIRNIATAAEEQSAASGEITHSLEEINRLASENATVMQQSAMAVSELAGQTDELVRLVAALRKK